MNPKQLLDMDPYILLSWINTKLRDEYRSLDRLCEDYVVSIEQIGAKMAQIEYVYRSGINQFLHKDA